MIFLPGAAPLLHSFILGSVYVETDPLAKFVLLMQNQSKQDLQKTPTSRGFGDGLVSQDELLQFSQNMELCKEGTFGTLSALS